MSSWNKKLMDMACTVAAWSRDPATKVGTVLANRNHVVVGLGYNGLPRGVDDLPERYTNRELKLKMVVHAEANAILNATESLHGSTCYTTSFPCPQCAGLLIQAGIVQIVSPAGSRRQDSKWFELWKLSEQMFKEAEIAITEVGI